MVAAGGEPHLCAVSMEYELFSASKLPVSYKASVMKHVNEIKRLTTQHELHAALFPCTADNCADVTSAGQTSMTSSEDPSPFKDVSSPVDTTAVNDAVRMVPDSHCDKNNVASSFTACELNRLEEGGERCDIINFDNIRELRSSVQSSFLSEIVASDRSVNFVDDCIGLKDGLHVRCKTQDDVKPSHNVDHLSSKSVKLESSATDTVLGATSNKSLKKKSVRISSSPPTVRYTNGQHKEVCNGPSIAVVKVSKLLCCIWLLWLHNSVKYAKVCSVVQTSSVVHSLLLLNVYIVHSSIHTVAVSSFFSCYKNVVLFDTVTWISLTFLFAECLVNI